MIHKVGRKQLLHIQAVHVYFCSVPSAFSPNLMVHSNHPHGPPLQYQQPEGTKEPKEILT